MRLSDAGLRCRQTKLIYPDHRPPPWLNEDATRDRSNRLLDGEIGDFASPRLYVRIGKCANASVVGEFRELLLQSTLSLVVRKAARPDLPGQFKRGEVKLKSPLRRLVSGIKSKPRKLVHENAVDR
jgi:hypothetical protein